MALPAGVVGPKMLLLCPDPRMMFPVLDDCLLFRLGCCDAVVGPDAAVVVFACVLEAGAKMNKSLLVLLALLDYDLSPF